MIIDASIAVPWFVKTAFSGTARPLRHLTTLAAPALILIETTHVMGKYARNGQLGGGDVAAGLEALIYEISDIRADESLIRSAADISLQTNHPVYDCLYLALAIETRDSLATADKRLAAVARSLSIETNLIEAAP